MHSPLLRPSSPLPLQISPHVPAPTPSNPPSQPHHSHPHRPLRLPGHHYPTPRHNAPNHHPHRRPSLRLLLHRHRALQQCLLLLGLPPLHHYRARCDDNEHSLLSAGESGDGWDVCFAKHWGGREFCWKLGRGSGRGGAVSYVDSA